MAFNAQARTHEKVDSVGECRAKTESAHPQAADKLAQLLFEFGSETVKGGELGDSGV